MQHSGVYSDQLIKLPAYPYTCISYLLCACKIEQIMALNIIVIKKYVIWNIHLPNAIVFHTPLSKYVTVTVTTLNYDSSRSSKVKGHDANGKHWWFPI